MLPPSIASLKFKWFFKLDMASGRQATLLFILSGAVLCSCQSLDMEKKLVTDLLAGYHDSQRPALDNNEPTVINFTIRLQQIYELNGQLQKMVSSVWIEQAWWDHKLQWDQSKYGGIKEVVLPERGVIWVPDVVLLNNAEKSSMGKPVNEGNPVLVESNGVVRWLAPVVLKSRCKMDVRSYPFDEQYCGLKFASWTGSQSELRLDAMDNDVRQNYSESSEWDLLQTYTLRSSAKATHSSPEKKSAIRYVIRIKRHVFYYIVYLLAPCLLTSLLAILLFTLPPESGERMVVGVTLLLSLTVFFLLAAKHIPQTSEAVPLIGKYYSLVIAEVSSGLFLTCWVLRFHHYNTSLGPLPLWIRIYVLGHIASIILYSVPDKYKIGGHADRPKDSENAIDSGQEGSDLPRGHSGLGLMAQRILRKQENDAVQEEWKLAALVVNRLFLIVYVLTAIFTLLGICLNIPELLGPRQAPPVADP